MMNFHYLTFVCEQPDLQDLLTEAGKAGWRLHTCEPMLNIGGSGLINILVVMDQAMDDDRFDNEDEEEDAHEGIAMRS